MPPSESTPPEKEMPTGWGWSPLHRLGLGLLTACIVALLLIQYARRPARLDDPKIVVQDQAASLPRLIDPNFATAEELSRIPNVGPKLAAAIVSYRDARKPLTEDGIVFLRVQDLANIPGIGQKKMELLQPHLQFPAEAFREEPVNPPAEVPAEQ